MRKMKLFLIFLLMAFTVSCTPQTIKKVEKQSESRILDADFHMEGVIVDEVFPITKKQFSMLGFRSGIGLVTIQPEAEIFIQKEDGIYPASEKDMVVGQRISLIFEDESLIETYPWGGKAVFIFLQDEGPQATSTPISTWVDPQIAGVILEKTGELGDRQPYFSNLSVEGVDTRKNSQNLYPSLTVNDTTLIWQKDAVGYHIITFDELRENQKVTILMREPYTSYTNDGVSNPILEIIVIGD